MTTTYATFWKCALQVNPRSYIGKYQGRDHGLSEEAYNEGLVQKCIANEIRVVGMADHGTVDGIEKLANSLEKAGIVVLPGFEIASTEKIHMVCLFPEGTDVATLNKHLGNFNAPVTGRTTAPSSLGCIEIAKRVHERGGFWYAAHVTGASGLLRLNQDGGGLVHVWCDCEHVLAAQIPGDMRSLEPKLQQILRNKNPDYTRSRPIALLNAKDVRVPEDLDDPASYSWVKMTAPTLEALVLACRDAESRIRLSHEINPAYYSRIERVVVRRGYLDDLEIDLSPNLNALVGGRGTGKSTFIEAIRYALDLSPMGKDSERAHKAIVEANFAKEKASIELTVTSFQQNSERYQVLRQHGEPVQVLDENGTVLKLSPSDILPKVEVYGQNELLAIVQDPGAKAKLLRRFLPSDDAERQELDRVKSALRQNRLDIDNLEAKVAATGATLEQLPALVDRDKSFKKLGLDRELAQVRVREIERAYALEGATVVESFGDAAKQFETSITEVDLPEVPSETSPEHASALNEITAAVQQAKEAALKAARQAAKDIAKAKQLFLGAQAKLAESFATDELVFNKQVNKMQAMKGKSVAQLAADYKRVSGQIAKLKPLGIQKATHEAKLLELNQARQTLLTSLSRMRSAQWSKLAKAVKELNGRLEGQLRVEFEPERIREPLKSFLMSCQLEGIGEKRLTWIDESESLSIADFVATIGQGTEGLQARFREARIPKQAADAIGGLAKAKLRELEEIELPERMELLLNVARDGENYREVGRLSTGQQCTAILHLLLLDNEDPLVIDQPEDNLDNAFIADHIVRELRISKTKRQFLFATHNANIPVFGDAEWIGVLNEEDGHAKLRASGSIDAGDVKELAANILEGGKEAFNRRREKYGL